VELVYEERITAICYEVRSAFLFIFEPILRRARPPYLVDPSPRLEVEPCLARHSLSSVTSGTPFFMIARRLIVA
jgi:hypothetical protein